jgi:N-acetylglucosaminyldiphosphoundecaprenol N-acetyl-beta-D-mannosaminyltransferase
MIDKGKKSVLGVLIDALDLEAAVARIAEAAKAQRPYGVTALAVHGVMTGVADGEHLWRLNHLDLVVPDGQPVRWALNLLHKVGLPDRVYGPRLMLEVCKVAEKENLPIFLYGSRPEVLERLQANLKGRFPGLKIAGALPSKFRTLSPEEQLQLAQEIRRSGAAIVFVGLGCLWWLWGRRLIFTLGFCGRPLFGCNGTAFSGFTALPKSRGAFGEGISP